MEKPFHQAGFSAELLPQKNNLHIDLSCHLSFRPALRNRRSFSDKAPTLCVLSEKNQFVSSLFRATSTKIWPSLKPFSLGISDTQQWRIDDQYCNPNKCFHKVMITSVFNSTKYKRDVSFAASSVDRCFNEHTQHSQPLHVRRPTVCDVTHLNC